MSFAKPLVASVSIRAFGLRSVENADGWGLAWYPDRSLAMVKQPVKWTELHSEFLDHFPGLVSSIYIAHVRHRTSGGIPSRADTHPFSREHLGREYCFAHNGTLKGDFWKQRLGHFHPIGTTDSETLFCLLMAELAKIRRDPPPRPMEGSPGPGLLETEEDWAAVHAFLLKMNGFGTLNCVLSDGARVTIYHDLHAWKGLQYRNIFLLKDAQRMFGDATLDVNLEAQPVNHGVIVATNPLSAEGWERFQPGELKVLHQGNLEHSFAPPRAISTPMKPAAAKAASA